MSEFLAQGLYLTTTRRLVANQNETHRSFGTNRLNRQELPSEENGDF